jgi:hypothetical protein
MKKSILGLCVASLAALTSGFASAAYVYGNPTLGTFYGSGNPQGEWWISSVGGVELGLRAKNRQTGGLLGNGADGIYNVDPGTCTGGLCGTSTNKATWNYDFSVDPGANPFLLTGLTYRLGVDHDPSAGTSYSYVNPATYWTDNTVVNSAFQNSENVKFGDTPGGAFDVNQQGLYSFILEAWQGETLLNSVSMQVQVGDTVPGGTVSEPGSLALMFTGLTALPFIRRKQLPAK